MSLRPVHCDQNPGQRRVEFRHRSRRSDGAPNGIVEYGVANSADREED